YLGQSDTRLGHAIRQSAVVVKPHVVVVRNPFVGWDESRGRGFNANFKGRAVALMTTQQVFAGGQTNDRAVPAIMQDDVAGRDVSTVRRQPPFTKFHIRVSLFQKPDLKNSCTRDYFAVSESGHRFPKRN